MPGSYQIGDALTLARELPDESVHCIVTSPPYWGMRSYLDDHDPAKAEEMGAEPTLAEYVARMVELFRELRRGLRSDGTCWLNLGDCYAGTPTDGLKPKDLCLVPYRMALALQADGWWLRSHIIWHKPNPMPESVTDRPTSAHEAVFLLTKSERYWYDADAVREPHSAPHVQHRSQRNEHVSAAFKGNAPTNYGRAGNHEDGRNKRNVWSISPEPYSGSHYAVMPPALVQPCILAGCPPGGLVLDPFGGSGTVGMVAESLGRSWLLWDLDARNAALIAERTAQISLLGLIDAEGREVMP